MTQWQPIETAPKDIEILVKDKYGRPACAYFHKGVNKFVSDFSMQGAFIQEIPYAKYWMPIPG